MFKLIKRAALLFSSVSVTFVAVILMGLSKLTGWFGMTVPLSLLGMWVWVMAIMCMVHASQQLTSRWRIGVKHYHKKVVTGYCGVAIPGVVCFIQGMSMLDAQQGMHITSGWNSTRVFCISILPVLIATGSLFISPLWSLFKSLGKGIKNGVKNREKKERRKRRRETIKEGVAVYQDVMAPEKRIARMETKAALTTIKADSTARGKIAKIEGKSSVSTRTADAQIAAAQARGQVALAKGEANKNRAIGVKATSEAIAMGVGAVGGGIREGFQEGFDIDTTEELRKFREDLERRNGRAQVIEDADYREVGVQ